MVLVVRRDLAWSKQKLAVMTAHAALALFKKLFKTRNPALMQWVSMGAGRVLPCTATYCFHILRSFLDWWTAGRQTHNGSIVVLLCAKCVVSLQAVGQKHRCLLQPHIELASVPVYLLVAVQLNCVTQLWAAGRCG